MLTRATGDEEHQDDIVLTLLPLSQADLQAGTIPDTMTPSQMRLCAPPSFSSTQSSRTLVQSVYAALRRCQAYTLCSLSFPSHSGQYLPHGAQLDLDMDTQRSVMGILNTGLPLPKSPSLQLRDNGRLGTLCDGTQEREERGWWTLRFQQVLREMQRMDPVISLEVLRDGDESQH